MYGKVNSEKPFYMKHHLNITHIYYNNYIQKAGKSCLRIIKIMCEKELFSYESRVSLTKKYLNIKTKIPIYINNGILLMPTLSPKRYENIWINYFKVYSFNSLNGKTVVLFKNLKEILLDMPVKQFQTMLAKAEKINNYFNIK